MSPLQGHPQLALAGGLVVAVGLGALALNAGLRPRGPVFPPGSHRSVLATTALAILLAGLAAVAYLSAVPGADPQSTIGFMVVAFSLHLALLAMTYLQGVRPGLLTPGSLGLSWACVPGGVRMGLLSAGALAVLAFGNTLVLNLLGIPQPQTAALRWLRDVPLEQFLVVAAIGALVAPLVEELFFRGYVFNAYLVAKGPRTAYLTSALLFGLLHGQLALLPALFGGGLVLAYAYRRSGTMVAPLIAHIVNNGIAFGSLLVTGDL
jgi:membrane protease YdiL (CAAX protease family)